MDLEEKTKKKRHIKYASFKIINFKDDYFFSGMFLSSSTKKFHILFTEEI